MAYCKHFWSLLTETFYYIINYGILPQFFAVIIKTVAKGRNYVIQKILKMTFAL